MINNTYYEQPRSEIFGLIKNNPKYILDIGCGKGGVARILTHRYPDVKVVGFDKYIDDTFDYNSAFESFHQVDLSHDLPLFDYSKFDLVLMLDVLEHLAEPEKILENLSKVLNQNVNIIISLPNFHSYSNLIEIIKTGRFKYKESGILDKTHLRFYGQRDARELIEKYFDINEFFPHHLHPRSFINKLASIVVGETYSAYQNIFLCSMKKF